MWLFWLAGSPALVRSLSFAIDWHERSRKSSSCREQSARRASNVRFHLETQQCPCLYPTSSCTRASLEGREGPRSTVSYPCRGRSLWKVSEANSWFRESCANKVPIFPYLRYRPPAFYENRHRNEASKQELGSRFSEASSSTQIQKSTSDGLETSRE